jgi:hypothetical protein
MREKILVHIGFLLIIITSVLISYLFVGFSKEVFKRGFFIVKEELITRNLPASQDMKTDKPKELPDNSETSREECVSLDSLEYYYYEETPVLWEENNKFGLYIYAEDKEFFELAQNVVNSNDGEWGYVLIPYNVKDRDYSKWNRVFEQLRNKRMIPIIQLWDVDLNNYKEQTKKSAEFLNSFIWPIKYRYISVYNEPNDSRFWYGKVDPEGYAEILEYTINIYKKANPDFFMLNGALNTSAPTDNRHLDSLEYIRRMDLAVPGIFEKLDGWASHPYPQPNFSGSPYVSGRWSIRAYENELSFLKEYIGLEKDLPVYITETGWAHAEGEIYNPSYLSLETVSEYLEIAFNEVWLKDDKVRAVVLFTIWYEPPFDHFAYINRDKVPYLHYEKLKEIDKINGKPPKLNLASTNVTECE